MHVFSIFLNALFLLFGFSCALPATYYVNPPQDGEHKEAGIVNCDGTRCRLVYGDYGSQDQGDANLIEINSQLFPQIIQKRKDAKFKEEFGGGSEEQKTHHQSVPAPVPPKVSTIRKAYYSVKNRVQDTYKAASKKIKGKGR